MANTRINVKNNYLIQLQLSSFDQTRGIAQYKTLQRIINFIQNNHKKINLEYNLYHSNRLYVVYRTSTTCVTIYASFYGNQCTQEHNSIYFNVHLTLSKYYLPELVIMNVSRNG